MDERSGREGTEQRILSRNPEPSELSWKATYKAIATGQEDWTDFEVILLDGLCNDEFEAQGQPFGSV